MFRDRAFGLIAGPTFAEPPRVVGIQSRVGSFCDCCPVRGFHNWRGGGDVTCLNGLSDVLDELTNGDV